MTKSGTYNPDDLVMVFGDQTFHAVSSNRRTRLFAETLVRLYRERRLNAYVPDPEAATCEVQDDCIVVTSTLRPALQMTDEQADKLTALLTQRLTERDRDMNELMILIGECLHTLEIE